MKYRLVILYNKFIIVSILYRSHTFTKMAQNKIMLSSVSHFLKHRISLSIRSVIFHYILSTKQRQKYSVPWILLTAIIYKLYFMFYKIQQNHQYNPHDDTNHPTNNSTLPFFIRYSILQYFGLYEVFIHNASFTSISIQHTKQMYTYHSII